MKVYEELTEQQKEKAVDFCLSRLLDGILDGAIRFSDTQNSDDLQARIERAIREADRLQTPWFAGECIMETCAEDLRGMATCDAEDSLYAEPGEYVIRLSDLK